MWNEAHFAGQAKLGSGGHEESGAGLTANRRYRLIGGTRSKGDAGFVGSSLPRGEVPCGAAFGRSELRRKGVFVNRLA